jgi:hypothetical protein
MLDDYTKILAGIIYSGDVPLGVRMQQSPDPVMDTVVSEGLRLHNSGEYEGKTTQEIIATLNRNLELAKKAELGDEE